jgi:Domain of Unknown Function (DUF1080)
MKTVAGFCAVAFLLAACAPLLASDSSDGWVKLFDGKSLDGWKASENAGTFRVENGLLIVDGPRSHLYYVGPVMNHNFKNFQFKADVMTTPGANSGIYFHTEYLEKGWPARGYEAQVNNTNADPRRTGGLYAIKDVFEAPARDNEWFTQQITVRGKHIVIEVNGKTVVDYTEPENAERPASMAGRLLSSGTFALQGHDPKSKVFYKNIMVKALPD